MLTNCGAKEKFFLNHAAMMRSQSRWIATIASASPAQQQRWRNPDSAQRNRAIAADFGFYAIMASRGYDRQTADKCLTDKTMEARLMKQSQQAVALGVRSTPSFAINGTVLARNRRLGDAAPATRRALLSGLEPPRYDPPDPRTCLRGAKRHAAARRCPGGGEATRTRRQRRQCSHPRSR